MSVAVTSEVATSVVAGMAWDVDGFVTSLTAASQHTVRAYEHDVASSCSGPNAAGARTHATSTTRRCAATSRTSDRGSRSARSRARPPRSAPSSATSRAAARSSPIPGARCASPKGPSRLPRVPRSAEAGALLDAAAPAGDHGRAPRCRRRRDDEALEPDPVERAVALRDLAVLELLYGTGLRVTECCGLDIGDVDLRQRTVTVLGKGSKSAGCRSAPRPSTRSGRGSARAARSSKRPIRPGARCSSTLGAGGSAAGRPPHPRPPSAARRTDPAPARPPARVRDAPARRRSRSADRARAARTRRSGNDPDLHSCHP